MRVDILADLSPRRASTLVDRWSVSERYDSRDRNQTVSHALVGEWCDKSQHNMSIKIFDISQHKPCKVQSSVLAPFCGHLSALENNVCKGFCFQQADSAKARWVYFNQRNMLNVLTE